jgi:NAD(P)-dependent dehydrogenase (short-subunit alcohol dehydrogenase family)
VAQNADPFRLDGKVAVVVGTSPNIGAGIAIELGRAGATVACLDANPLYAEKTADEVRAVGASAMAVTMDATSETSVAEAFAAVEAEFGLMTILVNGPVWFNTKGLLDMPFHEWQRQISIVLDGSFLCSREVIRRLVAADSVGSIICLTSTAAYQGEPGNVGYSTAKSGIVNFARSVAMEYADRHIRVNCLSPTATGHGEALERAERWGIELETNAEFFAEIAKRTPMGELPQPSDYGLAAVYLASPAAKLVTGTDMRVDSGTIARYWRWDPAEARR